jgi:hypothetical protein
VPTIAINKSGEGALIHIGSASYEQFVEDINSDWFPCPDSACSRTGPWTPMELLEHMLTHDTREFWFNG